MLIFIVPVKSRCLSRDWALLGRLFERTLRSVCGQTAPAFRVVVVCNERPQVSFQHPHVHYVEVDFPPPLPDRTEVASHGYEYSRSKTIERQNADKARKIRTAMAYAEAFGPTHTMVVDADDCVSRRLAAFVLQHPRHPGWYFRKGYLYPEGGRFLYLNRQNFNVVCGSSVVIAYARRQVLLANPDFYQHAFYDPPEGLVPLPFPGAVYSMANGDNIYMSADTRKHIGRTLLARLLSRRLISVAWKAMHYWPALLTRARRAEFGLYPIAAAAPRTVPAAPAASGAAAIGN